MKTFLTVILLAALTACSSGETIEASDKEAKVYAILPAEVRQEPIIVISEPEPVVTAQSVCDLTTYNPCGGTPLPPVVPQACNPKDAGCVVPEGMELCDIWSYNPCRTPTWIPIESSKTIYCPESGVNCLPSPASTRLILVTPSPEPVCIRDSAPLVYIDGGFTDNCGNKYGQTTQ